MTVPLIHKNTASSIRTSWKLIVLIGTKLLHRFARCHAIAGGMNHLLIQYATVCS